MSDFATESHLSGDAGNAGNAGNASAGDDGSVALRQAFREHPRVYQGFRYVYPVISRRAGGLSIGINLNPDKACNFDCVYCCVDRSGSEGGARAGAGGTEGVDPGRLRDELRAMIATVADGSIWLDPRFAHVPGSHRHLSDIAFSGDGEPTACQRFAEAVDLVLDALPAARSAAAEARPHVVLITNATLTHRPAVSEAIDRLTASGGEVWAKLDAGSEAYYRLIDRTTVPLARVLGNITGLARRHGVVIQTMVCRYRGESMPPAERDAYARRLREVIEAGGRIDRVQLYTVARSTHTAGVEPVDEADLWDLADRIGADLPGLRVDCYPG